MKDIYTKNDIYNFLGKLKASFEKKADYYYYIENDREMSSEELNAEFYSFNYISKLLELSIEDSAKILESALKYYNFSQSGKEGYKPSIEVLDELEQSCGNL